MSLMGAENEPTAERKAMGLVVLPYVHACCPGGCACSGRLARYVPGKPESFVACRPYSPAELAAQARRAAAVAALAPGWDWENDRPSEAGLRRIAARVSL